MTRPDSRREIQSSPAKRTLSRRHNAAGIAALMLAGVAAGPLPESRPTTTAPLPVARAITAQPDRHLLRIELVRREAERAGIPVAMALAVSLTENWSGDPTAVSSAGAVGIMQVMPDVWRDSFRRSCGTAPLTDPHRNACVGVRVLRYYYRKYRDWQLALRAYNGSMSYPLAGTRYVAEVMQRYEGLAG